MDCLVAVVGPTGIGKSELALRLAETFSGEIVNADSQQVYRHMDIGTAKPTSKELYLIPHHLISIITPDERFSLSQYQALAYRAINEIQRRDKLAMIVGGSGQYIWSVLENWTIPEVPPDLELRRKLRKATATRGEDWLYQELMKVDSLAAKQIDRRNVRRVIRALEVYQYTKTPMSQLKDKKSTPLNTLIIGLTAERGELYRKIDLRVDEMMKQGLVAETEKLVNMGYDFDLPAMSSIGYKQVGMFLRGELTLTVAIQQIKHETHRLVRHQYSWFRLKDVRINWFDIQDNAELKITEFLTGFMRR